MEAQLRWPTAFVERSALAHGDLFAMDLGDTDFLALAVGQAHVNYALILAQFGKSVFDTVPHMEILETFVEGDALVRRFSDGLVVEPVSMKPADLVSTRQSSPAPHGGLALLPGGRRGIYLRGGGGPGIIFDLATGESESRVGVRVIEHWRLLWTDGLDRVELCRF